MVRDDGSGKRRHDSRQQPTTGQHKPTTTGTLPRSMQPHRLDRQHTTACGLNLTTILMRDSASALTLHRPLRLTVEHTLMRQGLVQF
jgi:hypothetical protein